MKAITTIRRRAQGLAEILIAVVFLATAGLAIYSAQVNTLSTSAWAHERLFAQGVVRDLAETMSSLDYCDLQKSPFVEQMSPTESEENAITRVLAKGDAFQKTFDDDTSPFTTLRYESFFIQYDKTKTKEEMAKDPLYSRFVQTMKRIELKRAVLFKDDPAKGAAVVVCVVRFKSSKGQTVTLRHPFVKADDDTSAACP